ncbi:MAG TPA: sensor domain-containing diguanylate cyclase [Acidimicrobiales bacterium]|nr:sensor domain-containing diguanylate cyclase [Acidimicrobiales bacterium]
MRPVDTHEVESEGRFEAGPGDPDAQALRARAQLLERVAEALPVGVLHVDALRRVLYANSRLHEILGSPGGATLDEHLTTVIDADRARADRAFDAVLLDGVDSDIDVGVEPVGADTSGRRRCTISLRALTSEGGEVTGAVACVADVTESGAGRDEPRRHGAFDALTRCNDRASTLAALEAMVAGADAEAMPAVISVNMDHFKGVNDDHGRAAGDEFLGVVARRLHGAVREDDIVGRMGGDEFLVVCSRIATAAAAVRKANTIADSLRHEIQLKDIRVTSQASIGVAWSSGPETDVATLLARADAARRESKRRGAGRPVLFTPSLLLEPPPAAP